MRPFCPQFEIFRLEKNAMLTLEWIGKNKVVNHHQEVPFRVLERQYSFGEQGQHTENNDSENMIIHGDNLEALKALLPQYEGKVKCIYIVILTPILMSILSSENAVRLNFIIHIMFLALFEMHFVELYHGEFSEERLLRALRNIHPVDIYRIGQDDPAKLRGWKKYVFPIYTAYNGKCRKDALPMKF